MPAYLYIGGIYAYDYGDPILAGFRYARYFAGRLHTGRDQLRICACFVAAAIAVSPAETGGSSDRHPQFFAIIAIFVNCYKHVVIRKIGLLTLSGIVAAPLGSYLLLYVNETALKITAGGLIVLSSAVMLSGKTFQVRKERLGFVTVGLASGLLNGSISMSGPPVALFLSNQGTDKEAFRGNLTFYALLLNAVTIASYLYGGLLDEAVSETLAWLIPAMIMGVLLGIWAGGKLNETVFKKLTLILIIVSGCWTLWTAINGL